ncbi:TonB-dependent receptor [Shewanella sp. C32]|uniref:TonB-dependent receptor n=1 Tax=Shewanella electrica TaxID=515560 RepID=A0ABT2FGY7_9GAMM|nr:TonB-dependent receptor [Shewanella electrica]MCH1923500.1 TonB-dependent receptor [Shewanella electrica]MCS4555597.1 TonB-dependent receptor [Shewanella electrica]
MPSNAPLLLSSLALAVLTIFPRISQAASLEHIEVTGERLHQHHAGDASQRLQQLGVDFSAAGGVSALPVLNGMMGDRIKVLIDGADITAACANQMNPPLSYISANQISNARVIAGVSAVSAGGDNIAGVISVDAIAPTFTDSDELQWQQGYLSTEYRSVNDGVNIGAGASIASKQWFVEYRGNYQDANSYEDGHGDKVADTLYRSQNHSLIVAWRDELQQFSAKLSHQYIPFQGFANQYMDMTNNRSSGVNLAYQRQFNAGELALTVNWHGVSHEMGFFTDEKPGTMPMNTDGDDYSYSVRWTQPILNDGELRLGQEYFDFRLDDVWPAVPGSAMMGPNDYVNINHGKRQRVAAFAEIDKPLSARWWLSAGLRYEHVTTDAGAVQNYNDGMGMGGMPGMGMGSADAQAAMAFNAAERKQQDDLIDAVLQLRYQLSDSQQLELGLARKNRAPNLYERYSWGRGVMASTMIGWLGDGNGYVGDIDLKPETAYTASAKYSLEQTQWQFSSSVWYSRVHDYIDAQVIGQFNSSGLPTGQRNLLQFSNVDATLYGINMVASAQLLTGQLGTLSLTAQLAATRGERDDDNQPLYQIKPLQTDVGLVHQLGDWQSRLVWQFVGSKTRVDDNRRENPTGSYHLLNLQSQWTVGSVTLSAGIDNLLDSYYQLPLGGVSVADYRADNSVGFQQLAGQGRSVNLGLTYQF